MGLSGVSREMMAAPMAMVFIPCRAGKSHAPEEWADREAIATLGDLYCHSKSVIACWAMGITQHKNGVDNVRAIVDLLLLRGNIGRPGAGVCPVLGHSNVQGDRTMGIWEKPRPAFLDALEKHFDVTMPRDDGVDAVETVRSLADGRASVMIGMGGNFVRAISDSTVAEAAVRLCIQWVSRNR